MLYEIISHENLHLGNYSVPLPTLIPDRFSTDRMGDAMTNNDRRPGYAIVMFGYDLPYNLSTP